MSRTLLVTQAKLYEYLFNTYCTKILTPNIGLFYNTFDHYFVYLLTHIRNIIASRRLLCPRNNRRARLENLWGKSCGPHVSRSITRRASLRPQIFQSVTSLL